MDLMKNLYLSGKNKKLGGVFGGLGEYFSVDPTLLRLVWIVVTVFSGLVPGLLIYIIAWLVMPRHNS